MFRRRQFGDLIDRQLQVFAEDHGERLEAIREARSAYRTSDRDEVEERYGDYADELDWAAEELAAMRDGYAETLDDGDGTADRYVSEFNRAVQKTMPEVAAALEG
ncbi:MAG: hypothetical protein ACKO7U_05015 [Actinomycetota bacterium]